MRSARKGRPVARMKPCSRCPEIVPVSQGMCDDCQAQADRKRGTSTERGYGRSHRRRFREGVLARDPICKVCRKAHSTIADHYPLSRRELVAAGMDPDDPQYGRGLCKPCHDKHTAQAQPGGWRIAQDA